MRIRVVVAVIAAAILLCIPLSVSGFADGVVSIDSSSFDKVVTRDRATIVKFDRKNPHGDAEIEWRAFAEAVGSAKKCPVLPAEVNCHHEKWWNDESFFNMDLAERFNISFNVPYKEFLPTVLLFLPDRFDHPVAFHDHFARRAYTKKDFLRFLQQYTSCRFPMPGPIAEFNELAAVFLAAGDKEGALKKAEKRVRQGSLEWDKVRARVYTDVMKRVLSHPKYTRKASNATMSRIMNELMAQVRAQNEKKATPSEQRSQNELTLNVMSLFQLPYDRDHFKGSPSPPPAHVEDEL